MTLRIDVCCWYLLSIWKCEMCLYYFDFFSKKNTKPMAPWALYFSRNIWQKIVNDCTKSWFLRKNYKVEHIFLSFSWEKMQEKFTLYFSRWDAPKKYKAHGSMGSVFFQKKTWKYSTLKYLVIQSCYTYGARGSVVTPIQKAPVKCY
jgi:hypothetical protein